MTFFWGSFSDGDGTATGAGRFGIFLGVISAAPFAWLFGAALRGIAEGGEKEPVV